MGEVYVRDKFTLVLGDCLPTCGMIKHKPSTSNGRIIVLKHTTWRWCQGSEVSFHAFLTSELDETEWSASRPCRFNSGKSPGVNCIRKSVGPRPGLEAMQKTRISAMNRSQIFLKSSPQPSHYINWAIPNHSANASCIQCSKYSVIMKVRTQALRLRAGWQEEPEFDYWRSIRTAPGPRPAYRGSSFPGSQDHSPSFSEEAKEAWSYTSTPQYFFIVWCLLNL
jgi:ribosomal protein S26